MQDDDFDPFMDALRQMKSDIRQLEIDIGLIQNEELRVMARGLLFNKQELYLNMIKTYAMEGE
jgi:hypothetical protein